MTAMLVIVALAGSIAGVALCGWILIVVCAETNNHD